MCLRCVVEAHPDETCYYCDQPFAFLSVQGRLVVFLCNKHAVMTTAARWN